jgi:hypothetical protein
MGEMVVLYLGIGTTVLNDEVCIELLTFVNNLLVTRMAPTYFIEAIRNESGVK